MKLLFLFFLVAALSVSAGAQSKGKKVPYRDTTLSVEERVKDLLGRMTVEEKIRQLECTIDEPEGNDTTIEKGVGGWAVPLRPLGPEDAAKRANRMQKVALNKTRFGIPLLIHDEGLHGLLGKEATSFPQAIGLAGMWDPPLVQQVATVIARQARSRGIRQLLSPVINIARDVRWGRVEETYGEDPYLTSMCGVAFCRGLEDAGVISTPKHFAANVGDGGRDSHPIHFSERLLREIYFPAFKACFQDGHAMSVMVAYNSLDGVPCSSNRWLLTDVLRNEWGFKGFVVSDYGSVWGITHMHRAATNDTTGAAAAVRAGLDMELPGIDFYGRPLMQAVRDGLVPEATIDTAAGRVLAAKFRIGLFDHPLVDPSLAKKMNDTREDRALALRAAHESIVLLKNSNNILPLNKTAKTIAVIGPNADAKRLGGYSGFGMKVVTALEGIRDRVGSSATVLYAKGCELGETTLPPIPAANMVPPDAKPGEHGLRGEYFKNQHLEGKPALVRIDKQINFDWGSGSPDPKIPSDHFSARWTGKLVPTVTSVYRLAITTDDGVRVYLDGKLVDDNWVDRAPTSDYLMLDLVAGRAYDLRIEYYENAGGAFASLGWNLQAEADKEIDSATAIARGSDAAVVVAGILEGEGRDRSNLDLPGSQEKLIRAVAATGVPTIVVLMAGSAVTMAGWADSAAAILDVWYAGEEGGNAIADVLFGDYNPGGKLPITFPQSVGQVPLYYNTKPSGRGYDYVDLNGKPLYPFGHGLSYTSFEYSNLRIEPKEIHPGGSVRVGVDVRNGGSRAGDEVVQLYIHDTAASVSLPLKELKGFERINLAPGGTRTVWFTLSPEDLTYLDLHLKPVLEPGGVEILVGSSSEDIRVKGVLAVQ